MDALHIGTIVRRRPLQRCGRNGYDGRTTLYQIVLLNVCENICHDEKHKKEDS